ncbi:tetratricopeptide repeat protein [Bdellovibrio bacteriovorus]|uniref:tetratricopeptide repeat protein n=1 Tax=Bdellovibrio TaxID=958 RepID=UPI0035A9AA08
MMVLNSIRFYYIVRKRVPSILLGILALVLLATSQSHVDGNSFRPTNFVAPPPLIERFSFGFHESIADALWIRTLQDFDYCEQKIAENVCKNESWLFKMLDAVTTLSPNFRMPYAAGALALTIIISDIDGATKIFDKGVAAFPNDWAILYRAAYHYLYEVKDKKRAAELLVRAAQNGAPPWLYSLAGRLYSDSGHLELAESLLQDMIRNNQEPGLIKRLQDKINSMKNAPKSK